MAYATGSTGLAITVIGSSRRIMIMRFRPANIRLINRRSKLLRLLLALSSGNKKQRQPQKQPHSFRRVDTVTPYQANVLVDALPPCCRLIGTCGHARKVSRSQRYLLDGDVSETHVPSRACCLDFRKLGSMRHSISSEPFIHLISDCLRGGSNLRVPTSLLSEGHSAFPDQRMAPFSSRFQCAENPLLCPSGAKGAHFAGILEDCWLLFADSKRPKTVWWTWSGSNRRPLPCHGSALPAAPQAHRQTPSSLHERGRMTRWPALPTCNQLRSPAEGLF